MTTPEEAARFLAGARIKNDQENERIIKEKVVIIEKEQVNVNSPAIADLHFKFPEGISPPKVERMEKLMEIVQNEISISSYPVLKVMSENHYIVEIKGGSLMMYTWFDVLINFFKQDYGVRYPKIKVIGHWAKFGN
jgi:hypothetical protein